MKPLLREGLHSCRLRYASQTGSGSWDGYADPVLAVTIEQPGGPDTMVIGEVSDPQPRVDEVIVDVVAAGVNRADLLQREGRYPPPAGTAPYLGLECSGLISAVGAEVDRWEVGDEVCALLTGGGYAERVAVPQGQLLSVPPGVSIVDAAALPEVTCTVWSNLAMVAGLGEGETLLVHGGGSGIGTMAIQIAKLLEARSIVTCGSQRKTDACLALGADVAVNYREQDWLEAVHEATDGQGAQVVLDVIGAQYLDAQPAHLGVRRSARCDRASGRASGRTRPRPTSGQTTQRPRHDVAFALTAREG